ncbi:ATP-binding protein [Sorangium sp. So ce726]|uniref:ATP-binding protein n=1 Tax=Sorangium sp. So ce726 TaxID=3133319 RepID=UPI003F5D6BC7
MRSPMDLLGRPNPKRLSDFIQRHHDALLDAWKRRVQALSPARRLPAPRPIDHLPDILAYIAEGTRSAGAAAAIDRKHRGVPGLHALSRLAHGYDLADVVMEYAALRAVILELWEREGGGDGGRELIQLNGTIDEAIADAVSRYQAARVRLLQALDAISTAALGSSDLDTFLKALLRATREATAAVDVAIVLLGDGDALEVHATAGLDDGPLPGPPLEAAREFARAVLALRGPTSLDAAASGLPVTAREIRGRGLRAVYGVPLIHEGHSIGVAILGSRNAEEFSEDDALMLRTMTSRATGIIVQAQLVAKERASRRQADDARALLATVVEQMPAGLVIAEPPTGRVLLSNTQAGAIFGLPLLEVHSIDGYAVCRGFDPRSGRPYEARDWPLARTITTGEVVIDEEIDIVRDDGAQGRILVRSAPVRDPVGRVMAAVVTFFDITERTRTERGERFLAAASAALSDTLDFQGTLDRVGHLTVPELADWCVIQTLPDLEQSRGITVTHARPEELQRARALFRELDPPPPLAALLERALCSERPELIGDLSHPLVASLDENGAFRRFVRALGITSALVVPMVARGRTFGCITLATAGSGRVYDQADLAVAHDLAQRAALAADNARLYEAAQRAIELRDNVLATVSHDLRNPLSAILTAAAVMTKRAATRGEKGDTKAIQAIQRSAHRMDRLLHDLLDFASLRAGRLALRRQPQDPREIGREAVETFESQAQEKGVQLGVVATDDVPLVTCDRDRVLQVLTNLLSNALQVTGAQGAITLRCERGEEHVVFSVADTGPGIPEDELPHLFERFWRGQRNGYKGTGLGLAIARELVAAHGGTIHVESRVGVGTTFRFTIPVMDEG